MNTTMAEQRERMLDDLTRRGMAVYAERQGELERGYLGQMVAIHPDSGDWAADPDEDAAFRTLRARQPKGLLFVRRIGPPTAADMRFAARVLASELKK